MDPLSIALGAVGIGLAGLALFEPAVKACFEVWGFYQLSQNYGIDYRRIFRAYRLQITRTASMMTQKTSTLTKIPDPNTLEANAILDALAGIKSGIETCEGLMKKHEEPIGPRCIAQEQDQEEPGDTSIALETSLDRSSLQERLPAKRSFRDRFFKRKPGVASSPGSTIGSQMTRENKDSTTPASSISGSKTPDFSRQMVQTQDQLAQHGYNAQQTLKAKTKWIISDKQKFENSVKEIKSLNDFLQNTLMIKHVTGANNEDQGLICVNTWDRLEPDQVKRKSHLEHLHRTLQTLNGVGPKSVRLSIPLRDEPSQVLDDGYVKLSGNRINPGGIKYLFHTNEGLQSSETAKLIIAEFRFPEFDLNNDFISTIPSLKELQNEIKEVSHDKNPPLQCLGKFDGNENNPPVIIYQDVSRQFRKDGNLTQELQDQSWRARDFQIDHVRLARSVAEAFLILERTFASSLPRPSDFVNYSAAGAKSGNNVTESADIESYSSSEDDQSAEPIRNPSKLSTLSLSSGFGSALIQDTSSLLRIAQDGSLNIVVALGLILYQIGCWKHIKYKMNAHSLETARSKALGCLTEVDQYLPGQYTRAVEACLRWRDDELHDLSPGNMLERLATSLRNYEADIRHRF